MKNVGVNRAPVQIRHSGRAGDSGWDIFEKENLITQKIKRNKRASLGFRFGLANRVGLGLGVATLLFVQALNHIYHYELSQEVQCVFQHFETRT